LTSDNLVNIAKKTDSVDIDVLMGSRSWVMCIALVNDRYTL